ncbi:hypothetical protein VCHA34P120_20255 [Vibrio chagasii]|nr:hypothetical protein VCHA28FP16_20162 [Vibrio chagasii]CAH6902290.1 hypothetical protein VCHA34P120_20255 [Vibrio chagasii]
MMCLPYRLLGFHSFEVITLQLAPFKLFQALVAPRISCLINSCSKSENSLINSDIKWGTSSLSIICPAVY